MKSNYTIPSESLKAEIKAKTAELERAHKEIMNLKAEVVSIKETQATISPNKLKFPFNSGVGEITPIKETVPETTSKELYTHTTARSDEPMGIEYQLQLEVTQLFFLYH